VRITGTGLYSGELATIEKLASGAIPSAVVRTEAGRTRQVRTIDLEPVAAAAPAPSAAAAPAAAPAASPASQAAPAISADPGPPDDAPDASGG
jgi:hypothetical protein